MTSTAGCRWLRSATAAFRKRAPQRWEGVKTCNLAAWRDDLLRVNGLDESYSGWGLEDSDLVIRLLHAGVRHKSARFAAPVFHLWHAENDRSRLAENQRRLDALITSQRVAAEIGRQPLPMNPPRSVLVVVTRRIGDVLLATPLIRSLKRAWPEAAIDVLVFAGTEGVLAANPDIRRVITIAERPGWRRHLALLAGIARRYDVALSVVPSDRPTLYAWLAGRWRAGLVLDERKHRWKKWLLQRWVPFDNLNTHTVLMHLALARVLDIAPCHDVIAAWSEQDSQRARAAVAVRVERTVCGAAYVPQVQLQDVAARRLGSKLRNGCAHKVCASCYRAAARPPNSSMSARLRARCRARSTSRAKLTLSQAACLLAHARALCRTGYRAHAYGGGTRRAGGRLLRTERSGEMGPVAGALCTARQSVAASWHATRQQRHPDPGQRRVRAVPQGRLRPAHRRASATACSSCRQAA